MTQSPRQDIQVRHYRPGEEAIIAQIFTDSVHSLTKHHYTEVQRGAWAPIPPDLVDWTNRCRRLNPFVAVNEREQLLGFLELEINGHIECSYVTPLFARRGIMTILLHHAEEQCRKDSVFRMFVEASHTARPFFESNGFRNLGLNRVERRGISFENWKLEKVLAEK